MAFPVHERPSERTSIELDVLSDRDISPQSKTPLLESAQTLQTDLDTISKEVETLSTSIRQRTFKIASFAFIGGVAASLTLLCTVLSSQVGLPLNGLQSLQAAGGAIFLVSSAVATYKYVHLQHDQQNEAQRLQGKIQQGETVRKKHLVEYSNQSNRPYNDPSDPNLQLNQTANEISYSIEKTEVNIGKTLLMPFALGFAIPLIATTL